jgi:hypothetical protein
MRYADRIDYCTGSRREPSKLFHENHVFYLGCSSSAGIYRRGGLKHPESPILWLPLLFFRRCLRRVALTLRVGMRDWETVRPFPQHPSPATKARSFTFVMFLRYSPTCSTLTTSLYMRELLLGLLTPAF